MSYDEFESASAPSGGIKWKEYGGALFVIEPLAEEAEVKTDYGTGPAVRANVYVLAGPNGQEDYPDCLIFPKILQSQTKTKIGKKVVGRLAQGLAKPGQSAPWQIAPATPEDISAAQAWSQARQASQFASAAPAVQAQPQYATPNAQAFGAATAQAEQQAFAPQAQQQFAQQQQFAAQPPF